MAAAGWCPSGRLFEAAACGAAVVSDSWSGLETFFALGAEILIARHALDVMEALDLSDLALRRIGQAARAGACGTHV